MAAASAEAEGAAGPRVVLRTNDGELFDVPLRVLRLSTPIRTMMEDFDIDEGSDGVVDVVQVIVSGPIMRKVIEWCEHYHDDPPVVEYDIEKGQEAYIPDWDRNFLELDKLTLTRLILAANYMDIAGLLDVTCKMMHNVMLGKTTEEIKHLFHLALDFTPESSEEDIYRRRPARA